jgi:hypothetical protein
MNDNYDSDEDAVGSSLPHTRIKTEKGALKRAFQSADEDEELLTSAAQADRLPAQRIKKTRLILSQAPPSSQSGVFSDTSAEREDLTLPYTNDPNNNSDDDVIEIIDLSESADEQNSSSSSRYSGDAADLSGHGVNHSVIVEESDVTETGDEYVENEEDESSTLDENMHMFMERFESEIDSAELENANSSGGDSSVIFDFELNNNNNNNTPVNHQHNHYQEENPNRSLISSDIDTAGINSQNDIEQENLIQFDNSTDNETFDEEYELSNNEAEDDDESNADDIVIYYNNNDRSESDEMRLAISQVCSLNNRGLDLGQPSRTHTRTTFTFETPPQHSQHQAETNQTQHQERTNAALSRPQLQLSGDGITLRTQLVRHNDPVNSYPCNFSGQQTRTRSDLDRLFVPVRQPSRSLGTRPSPLFQNYSSQLSNTGGNDNAQQTNNEFSNNYNNSNADSLDVNFDSLSSGVNEASSNNTAPPPPPNQTISSRRYNLPPMATLVGPIFSPRVDMNQSTSQAVQQQQQQHQQNQHNSSAASNNSHESRHPFHIPQAPPTTSRVHDSYTRLWLDQQNRQELQRRHMACRR